MKLLLSSSSLLYITHRIFLESQKKNQNQIYLLYSQVISMNESSNLWLCLYKLQVLETWIVFKVHLKNNASV